VRCWGFGGNGRLGYANTTTIGDDAGETPGSVGPVDLGNNELGRKRTAKAISAGDNHTCAILDDDTVRCWGYGGDGRLGYGGTSDIGDDETPGSVGQVDLGLNRTAQAISAGGRHTCARLDDGRTVRCWGYGANGRLGYCNQDDIGDNDTPGSVGPVDIGGGGSACARSGDGAPNRGGAPPPGGATNTTPGTSGARVGGDSDAIRGLGLGGCRAAVERRARLEGKRARNRSARARVERSRSRARRVCLKRYGRTPGSVTRLRARAASRTKIVLSFRATGTDGHRPPAARTYLVRQSRHPIRDARKFARAQTLCKGRCRFPVTRVDAPIQLTVTDLHPGRTYYYAIAAIDSVSEIHGPRSKSVKARTP